MVTSISDIKKTLQSLGYRDFKDVSANRLIVLTNLDRYPQLEKIRDAFRNEGATWDRNLTTVSGLGAIRIKSFIVIVKPLKRTQGGGDNENRFFENINKAIKEYGSPITINFVAPNRNFVAKNVTRAIKVAALGHEGTGIKADVVLKTTTSDIPISIKAKNASFWQTADRWSKDAKNWIDQLVYEKKVKLVPNHGVWDLKPNVAWKANDEDTRKVVFGSDLEGKGAVITKTFFHEDFVYDGKSDTLNVGCANIIVNLSDITEEYKVWFFIHTDRSSNRSDLYKGLRVRAAFEKTIPNTVYRINDTYSTGAPPKQPDRPIAFTFGRMNPPTFGHKKLIDRVKSENHDYRIYVSQTHDNKKNPLTYEQKHAWLAKMFPGYNIVKDTTVKTPFDAIAKMVDEGYNNISFVVGGDRVEEFKRMLLPYINNPNNPKSFVLNKFQVVNAGERDPDAEGISGMSSSKMREAAINSNFELFRTGVPLSKEDALRLFNDVRKGLNIEEYKEAKSSIPAPKEELGIRKNTHISHIEDQIINKGKDGARESLDFLKSIIEMLKGHSPSKVNITTKWDGAPALICGIYPENKQFFVGTKSVFSMEPKVLFTEDDIKQAYGSVPSLAEKLKIALKYLPELGITNVIQGDFLYTEDSLKSETIENEKYVTFRPNTITYAVPEDSDLAKTIKESKMGIVFHTSYHGTTLKKMSASFGFDASKLKESRNVWATSAEFKDFSGSVTFTNQESQEVERYLAMVNSTFSAISSSFYSDLKKNKNMVPYIRTYINYGIKTGMNPAVDKLIDYINAKYTEEIQKLKSDSGRLKKDEERKQLQDFIKRDKLNFEKLFIFWNQITTCKLKILKKLQQIKTIPTFIKTSTGYVSTSPEGYVAIDKLKGNAVKIVNRMEFSRLNFTIEKDWIGK